MNENKKCRERAFHKNSIHSKPKLIIHCICQPVLASLICLLIPASVYSCSSITEASETLEKESKGTRLRIKKDGSSGAASTDTLDILTFCNDALMRLDSYTRLEGRESDSICIASQAGEKIIFICANSQRDRNGWAGTDSYHSLGETYIEI